MCLFVPLLLAVMCAGMIEFLDCVFKCQCLMHLSIKKFIDQLRCCGGLHETSFDVVFDV